MNGLPFLQHLIIVPVLLPMLVGALLIPVNQNRHQLKFACSLASAVLLWLLSVALLRLADRLYGKRPDAWVVGIPAFNFDIGESVSPATLHRIDEAVALLGGRAAMAGKGGAG